jgi:hypothetical protein
VPSFLSSLSRAFPFNWDDSDWPDEVGVAMAEKVVKIDEGTACGALESEIEGNEIRKDCNALTGSARAGVRDVFFCRQGRSSEEVESSLTFGGFRYSYRVAISCLY